MEKDTQEFLSVVAVTENEADAKILAEVFLIGYSETERKEILTELGKLDSRFKDWDSQYSFEYSSKNVRSNSLYLGSSVAKIIESGNYRITVTLKEIL